MFVENKIYKTSLSNLKEAESLLKVEKDSEMIAMAKLEIESINTDLPKLEEEIKHAYSKRSRRFKKCCY